jgi:K+-sensing histidine kinase KdpD
VTWTLVRAGRYQVKRSSWRCSARSPTWRRAVRTAPSIGGGSGIPAGDFDRIFDRFYRAVDVRTEPGSGLGLSIVDEIVRSHSGRVFARNRKDGGAEVGFTLRGATTGS